MAPVVRLSGYIAAPSSGLTYSKKGSPTVSQNICKEGTASHACENEQKSKDELSKQQEVKGFPELRGNTRISQHSQKELVGFSGS
jgi:hypothetical protein